MSAILVKYGAATTIYFPLISFNSVSFTSTASLTTADSKISKNGAAFTTTSNAVASVGSYGYSLTLTTGDTTCLRAMIVMHHTAASPTFEDTMILLDTYGNASAQHVFDLSVANQSVIASAGTVTIGASGLSSGAVAAGAFSAGAFAAGFLSAGGIAAGAISAGGIAAAALSSGAFAAGFLSTGGIATGAFTTNVFVAGFISAGGIAASAISSGAFVSGAVTASGNFPTNFKDLTISATTGLVSISTAATVIAGTVNDKTGYSLTQTFPTNFSALGITAGGLVGISTAALVIAGTVNDKTGYSLTQTFPTNFSDLSITVATGLVSISTAQLVNVGTVAAGVVTSIWNKAMVEPTAVPVITASVLSAYSWMFMLSKHTIVQSSVLQTVYKSDGSTLVASATIGDDGTLFTRGSFN